MMHDSRLYNHRPSVFQVYYTFMSKALVRSHRRDGCLRRSSICYCQREHTEQTVSVSTSMFSHEDVTFDAIRVNGISLAYREIPFSETVLRVALPRETYEVVITATDLRLCERILGDLH